MVPQEATSDVKAFIDRQPFTRFQATVLGLCILVMAFDAIDLTAMGLIAPALSDDWGIPKSGAQPGADGVPSSAPASVRCSAVRWRIRSGARRC